LRVKEVPVSDVDIVHPALHPENIVWILSQLSDAQVEEFRAGLGEPLNAMKQARDEGGDVVGAIRTLVAFLDGWLVSVQLAHNAEWRAQMLESRKLIDDGGGEVASVDDLRRMLAAS
jgi:hypothetical protein